MKNRASVFMKQIISLLSSVAKAKSMAIIKSKASAIKTRLIVLSTLKNRKVLLGSVSHKIHALLGRQHSRNEDDIGDQSKAIVLYNAIANEDLGESESEYESEDTYPDLTHSLFDSDEDEDEDEDEDKDKDEGGGSVIDLVRKSKEEGEDFKLEDEINHIADLFIRRFHRDMRMQKQESLKRYEEMLERSA
ncbi:hypothetical protein HHK36_029421 [Tetracentron sinense]|uniref:DUF761 domain-containing protein n=1 Tax=Tetracentron sinense TaxID=13715 RepID=A0A835CZQ7_TETSI|nr:hypothetical protein HHK36_029421 [Tetracentron sinense]